MPQCPFAVICEEQGRRCVLAAKNRTDCDDDSVVHVSDIDDLKRIHQADCAAVIWQRPEAPSFQSWINELDPCELPQARLMIDPKDMRATLERIFSESGAQAYPDSIELIDDMVRIADRFVDVMSSPFLHVRIERVTDNSCRKFHVDYLSARLVCTYRGKGTQYGFATSDAQPQRIFDVPTSSPMLMRGRHWPTVPESKLLHRSPPIEGSGETRLLLVLDPLTEIYQEL